MADRDARGRAGCQHLEKLAGDAAVEVDEFVDPKDRGRDDARLSVCHDTDVADDSLVDDLVHDLAIVHAAFRHAADAGSLSGLVGSRHDATPPETQAAETLF